MAKINYVNLNFYNIFKKFCFTDNTVTNDNINLIYDKLFVEEEKDREKLPKEERIPLFDERDRNRRLRFRNGSYKSRQDLSKLEIDFLNGLEGYLIRPSGRVDPERFNILLKRLVAGIKKCIELTDRRKVGGEWDNDLDMILRRDKKALLALISDHRALAYGVRRLFDKGLAKEALLWLVLFSFYPEIREDAAEIRSEKRKQIALSEKRSRPFNITYTRFYQALLAREDSYSLFGDTLENDEYTSDDLAKKLSKLSDETITDNVLENILNDYYRKGSEIRLPDILTQKTLHDKANRNRILFVRFVLMRAFELYSKYDSRSCGAAQDLCRLILDLYTADDENDPIYYDTLKALYLLALTFWKLKMFSEEENRLLLLRAKLLGQEVFRPQYHELAHYMFTAFGRRANRVLELGDAISSYSAAFILADPDDFKKISSVRNNLAIVYRKFMKLDSSCYAYEMSYKFRKIVFPEDSESTARLLTNYSNPLRLSKQYDKAIEKIKLAFNVRLKIYNEDPSNEALINKLNYTSMSYALIYVCKAEDKLFSKGVGADISGELKSAGEKLLTLPNYTFTADSNSRMMQLAYANREGIWGKIAFLQSFKKLGRSDDSLKAFENAASLLSGWKKNDKTFSTIYGMCRFAQAKVHLLRFEKNSSSSPDEVIKCVLEGWDSISSVNSSLNDRDSYRYYYAAACFHAGALIELLIDSGRQELAENVLGAVGQVKQMQLMAAEAAKKLIADSLNMIHYCQLPDLSLPYESEDILWRFLNRDAFSSIEAAAAQFLQLCGNSSAHSEKAELFMKYHVDLYLA